MAEKLGLPKDSTAKTLYDYTDTIIAIGFNKTVIPGFTDDEKIMEDVELFKGYYYDKTWVGDPKIRELFNLGFFNE